MWYVGGCSLIPYSQPNNMAKAIVDNQEEKRVSTRYMPHVRSFGKSCARNSNRSLGSKFLIVGVVLSASKHDSNENISRTWHKTSVQIESIIKITKNASSLQNLAKIKGLAA